MRREGDVVQRAAGRIDPNALAFEALALNLAFALIMGKLHRLTDIGNRISVFFKLDNDDSRVRAESVPSRNISPRGKIMKAEKPSDAAREAFHQRMHANNMYGLWELASQMTPHPQPKMIAHMWPWSPWSRSCSESAKAVPVGDERRALQLFNPGLDGRWATTNNLIAAVQVLLPGEVARAHRHTPTAIRFIIEGTGAYTAVDGERVYMEPGDLILTPSWSWHDHGNETQGPRRLDGRPRHPADRVAGSDVLPVLQSAQVPASAARPTHSQAHVRPRANSLRPGLKRRPTSRRCCSTLGSRPGKRWTPCAVTTGSASTASRWSIATRRPAARCCRPWLAASSCCAPTSIPKRTATPAARSTTWSQGEGADDHRRQKLRLAQGRHHRPATLGDARACQRSAKADAILFSIQDAPVLNALGLYYEEEFTDNGGHQTVTSAFTA